MADLEKENEMLQSQLARIKHDMETTHAEKLAKLTSQLSILGEEPKIKRLLDQIQLGYSICYQLEIIRPQSSFYDSQKFGDFLEKRVQISKYFCWKLISTNFYFFGKPMGFTSGQPQTGSSPYRLTFFFSRNSLLTIIKKRT